MDAVTLTDAGLEYVQKKIETLNIRADKLGLPRVTLEVQTELVKQSDLSTTRRHLVTVHGPAPVVAGYRLIARIDHLSDGNIVCAAPDSPPLDPYYRSCPATCQHCLTTRRRNSTFLLAAASGDRVTQVGRNCLADYCRSPEAAEAIVQWGAWTATLDATIREASGLSGGERLYDCVALTRAAILVSDHFGWVPAWKAKEDYTGRTVATSSRVLDVLNPKRDSEPFEYADIRTALAEGHRQTEADAVKTWVSVNLGNRDENELTDYLSNLVVAFRCGAVDRRHVGIVVSAFAAHRRESAQQADAARQQAGAEAVKPCKHVGVVGERVRNLPVKVTFIKSLGMREYSGRVSEGFICKFETIDGGDPIVWFTGENLPYKEGEFVTIDAGVKEHGEYNGRPSTVVSRVSTSKEKPVKKPRVKKGAES